MSASVDDEAEAAEALMRNPLLQKILAELDSDAIRAWRGSSSAEQREAVYHEMMAIQRLGARIRGRLESKMLNDRKPR